MNITKAIFSLALIVLFPFNQVHATVSTSAELVDFKWQVIDLNTTDGIASYANYTGNYRSWMRSIFNDDFNTLNMKGQGYFDGLSYNLASNTANTEISVEEILNGGVNIRSTSSANGDFANYSDAQSTIQSESTKPNFLIGPNSHVIFSGDYNLSATGNLPPYGGYSGGAGVILSVFGTLLTPTGESTLNSQRSNSGNYINSTSFIDVYYLGANPSPSFSGSLFASYTNNTNIPQVFTMDLLVLSAAGAGIYQQASPVPEPANIVLFLAGLVPVCVGARRRRSHNSICLGLSGRHHKACC